MLPSNSPGAVDSADGQKTRSASWVARAVIMVAVMVVVSIGFSTPGALQEKGVNGKLLAKAARRDATCAEICGLDAMTENEAKKGLRGECVQKCEEERRAAGKKAGNEGGSEVNGKNGNEDINFPQHVAVGRDLSKTNVGIYVIENGHRSYLRMGSSQEGYGVNAVPHLQAWERWDVVYQGYYSHTSDFGSHGTKTRSGYRIALRNRQWNRYLRMRCGSTGNRYITSQSYIGDEEKLQYHQSSQWPNYYRIYSSFHGSAPYNPCYLQIWSGGVHANPDIGALGAWIHFT